ncbi:MAG: hypothetical protein H5T86_03475 [Armatimonadetes bacterium]|nr:hypothetical protein [Armatimonadota bacterium]
MTEAAQHTPLDELKQWLDRVIAGLQYPQERRIGYGNARHEYSDWGSGDDRVTNIAIVYEVPGGSTCQLNISYHHKDSTFSYLDESTGDKVVTSSVEDIQRLIEAELQNIPHRRRESLLRQVDRWLAEGMTRSDVFAQLNSLLQAEFLGGRINNKELQAAVQHVVRSVQRQAANPP